MGLPTAHPRPPTAAQGHPCSDPASLLTATGDPTARADPLCTQTHRPSAAALPPVPRGEDWGFGWRRPACGPERQAVLRKLPSGSGGFERLRPFLPLRRRGSCSFSPVTGGGFLPRGSHSGTPGLWREGFPAFQLLSLNPSLRARPSALA